MTARLVSDATTMTVLLAAMRCPALDQEDTDTVIRFALLEQWSDALDIVRRYDVLDGLSPAVLLGAIEEANEEAARTHDEREIPENYQCGAVILPSGRRIDLADREAVQRELVALFGGAPMGRALAAGSFADWGPGDMPIRPGELEHAKAIEERVNATLPTGVSYHVKIAPPPPAPDPARGKVTLTAKHPIPWSDGAEMRHSDALAAASRAVAPSTARGVYEEAAGGAIADREGLSEARETDKPSRRWTCPKCTSDLAVDRIAEILASRFERYTHVIRCLCGEVRP